MQAVFVVGAVPAVGVDGGVLVVVVLVVGVVVVVLVIAVLVERRGLLVAMFVGFVGVVAHDKKGRQP